MRARGCFRGREAPLYAAAVTTVSRRSVVRARRFATRVPEVAIGDVTEGKVGVVVGDGGEGRAGARMAVVPRRPERPCRRRVYRISGVGKHLMLLLLLLLLLRQVATKLGSRVLEPDLQTRSV